jgi:hypothetical protein
MPCLSYYCLYFSSTKLERRAEQILPGSKGRWGERMGAGKIKKKSWHLHVSVNCFKFYLTEVK